jgi:hypothetical protein
VAKPSDSTVSDAADEGADEQTVVKQDVPQATQDEVAADEQDKGGTTAFSRDRLLRDAQPLLGLDTHVVAGALHASTEEYLTIDEARALVETWLTAPVGAES